MFCTSPELRSVSSYGRNKFRTEFWSQCHIFRWYVSAKNQTHKHKPFRQTTSKYLIFLDEHFYVVKIRHLRSLQVFFKASYFFSTVNADSVQRCWEHRCLGFLTWLVPPKVELCARTQNLRGAPMRGGMFA